MTVYPRIETVDQLFDRCTTEPNTGCWLWLGNVKATGYGRLSRCYPITSVHRFAYTLKHGSIPDGLWILHKCDVPLCANPDHLYAGTVTDNVADAVRRNRLNKWNGRRRDDGNPRAKLNWDLANSIRLDSRNSEELAALYGVSVKTIGEVKGGRKWNPTGDRPSAYGFGISSIGSDRYRLVWTVDHRSPTTGAVYARRNKRDDNERGARRFAARHNVAMPEATP